MRRSLSVAIAAAVALVLTACGNGDPSPEAAPDTTLPPGPTVPVRVTGLLAEAEQGWLLCPGAVAPCWPVVEPSPDLSPGLVVATGTWDRDTISIESVELAPDDDPDLENPCADDTRPVDGTWDESAPFEDYAYADEIAGIWVVDDVLVVSVTEDEDRHRAALAALGVEGVCVADLGFEHSQAELETALEEMAERWPAWGDQGWVVLSGGVDVTANRLIVAFDLLDQRGRDEIESTWGNRVEIRANVEVLDGPVDQLDLPPDPAEIPIATGPRGAGGMLALGQFTLRFDDALGCLWLESGDEGERVKPIWPHGYRAVPGPVRVLDGRGQVVAVADQELELAGGFGKLLSDADDPTDCGAETVWAINPD
jgi:hypothetical protein